MTQRQGPALLVLHDSTAPIRTDLEHTMEDTAPTAKIIWTAGWNMPGYLPETEPQEFDDWQAAHGYIYYTVQRFWDQDAGLDGEPEDAGPDPIYLPVDTALNSATHGEPFSATQGDDRIVYWISSVSVQI